MIGGQWQQNIWEIILNHLGVVVIEVLFFIIIILNFILNKSFFFFLKNFIKVLLKILEFNLDFLKSVNLFFEKKKLEYFIV